LTLTSTYAGEIIGKGGFYYKKTDDILIKVKNHGISGERWTIGCLPAVPSAPTFCGGSAVTLVDFFGVFDDWFNILPVAAFQFVEKTASAPSMASDPPGLLDFQQDHIAIAVSANFDHLLRMTGFLTLVPQFAAGT
jgi:hypothetical protein